MLHLFLLLNGIALKWKAPLLDNTLQSRGAKRGRGEQSRDPELVGQGWGLSQFLEPPIRSCLLMIRFQTGPF